MAEQNTQITNAATNPPANTVRPLTIALAGNANVGKSAIFNQLTGLEQETGNWSGKTVAIKEGQLAHHGLDIRVVDLPGVYSFSVYSPDEALTRRFILEEKPDVVIDVLDATSMERNLYLTLLLKELDIPCVIALNYSDVAGKKHLNLDLEKLQQITGFTVIKTIAIKGIGVHELVDAALSVIKSKNKPDRPTIKYGAEIEERLELIEKCLIDTGIQTPLRWTALKLLENDPEISTRIKGRSPALDRLVESIQTELTLIHGEDSATVIASERYAAAARIARQTVSLIPGLNPALSEKKAGDILDNITLHRVWGYVLFILTMAAILVFISFVGGWITDLITNLFESFNPHPDGRIGLILWNGGVVGLYAALSVALGFILPFYLILAWLAESGYLPRLAFMLDRPCHALGLHGQASLPLIMGLGCNVPACLSCRILENRRDRLIASFLSTLVPCSARTSVVLGLVGAFVGWQWAVALLIFQFLLIFLVGRILNKIKPNQSPGIIMEIPEYRIPSLKIVWNQAWFRFKDFLTVGIPLIVVGSMAIEALQVFNWLEHITRWLEPITVGWLGLPSFCGVLLIIGILRKEANLALLIALAGGVAVTAIMTPLQMVVFSLVVMLYVPCISTIAVLVRETGLKLTAMMVAVEVALAVLIGGLAYRLLPLISSL